MSRYRNSSRLLLSALVMLAACYPEGADFVQDADVVLTNYNPAFNFKGKTTYAIPDKIVKIKGNVADGDPPEYIPDAAATSILNRINSNMAALGYTKVDISASPTIIVAPAAMTTTTISYWYDYWGWYWGGYYPGWGYPYPGWGYTPVYASSYTTGTLLISIVDPQTQAGDGNALSQWTAAANGILTKTYDPSRVNKLIDQAFMQSPYLKK